ncbi:MAG TPA: alanine racemase, partial [Sphingobacteriaceae bacterium]|nr:alanine racemase [Sphingobacteriaceae bacterium]
MAQKVYSIPELVKVMDPMDQHIADSSAQIDTLAYDSRRIRQASLSLFFALQGVRDGHDFIAAAYEKGVRNFVVSLVVDYTNYPDANFFWVRDSLRAMQQLAGYHRSLFDYPVMAITGSNGKTIVKDWLFQLLSPEYRIIRSPKSFNSQLGVALSLWQMDDTYDLALIEAGISRAGEMKYLAEMIRPDLGVLTNLGMAHQEGFADADEKESEKALMLQDVKQAVYPQDSRVQVEKIETVTDDQGRSGTRISARDEHGRVSAIHIPFTDRASIDNAITCWAVMRMLDYDPETIAQRMPHLQVMEMRLELKQGLDRSTLIDDSYSNDLSSLTISLDLLSQQQQHDRKTLILSDLPELGTEEVHIYEQVRRLLESHQLDQLITVGPALAANQGTFPVREHVVFQRTEDLLAALPTLNLSDRSILIKGARHYAFERISARLTARTHETIMEIDMSALAHNVQAYQAHIGPSVGLMVMVKAFAYGVGSPEVAALLQFQGVDYLAVAFADEGVELRRHGITLPILVMSADV